MKPFWKTFFASGLSTLIIGLVLIFIFIGALMAALGSFGDKYFGDPKPMSIKKNSILHIKFDKDIGERSFSKFDASSFQMINKMGIDEIKSGIKAAKEDEKIKGIFLDITSVSARPATIEELREVVIDFKTSGKFVVAYSEMYTQGAYYLASVADEIYLYPTGMLELKGMGTEMMFFKGAFDKLDVNVQVIRGSNNKFKSAVEPFMYEKMSGANREQVERFLTSMWNHIAQNIASDRKLTLEKVNEIAGGLLVRKAEDAQTHGLVDGLKYYDEIIDMLKAKAEMDEKAKDLNLVNFNKYARKAHRKELKANTKKKQYVAVVYAVGGIESGKGDAETIGSETIAKAIRDARLNDSVKAIVLRVNSPGGSALASDVIWREVLLAKQAKPFIVSMGDLAASGGYYISCAADRIFAQPNTITGSIGVFGVIPSLEKTMKNKLGITFDRAQTHPYSVFSMNKDLTPEEIGIIQQGVDDIYNVFMKRVADGRDKTIAEVDSVGQGRVWTGNDALNLGLVDEIGGINKAIAFAAEKAGLDDFGILPYPKAKDNKLAEILEQIEETENIEAESKAGSIDRELLKQIKQLREISRYSGIQARMMYDFDFK
ncbi:MAG: signal peptide peptidase SppA [Flavobacteriales bacterium]